MRNTKQENEKINARLEELKTARKTFGLTSAQEVEFIKLRRLKDGDN